MTTEIDIPLYGAAFLDDERLVVAGGGGLGNHGLKNQLVAINIKDNSRAEYDFPKGSDCPMSIAARLGQLVVGANSSGAVNNHFHLFDSDLNVTLQQSFFDGSLYQRSVAIGQEKLAILGTCDSGESLVIAVESTALSKLWTVEFKDDVRDLSFSENGELLAVVLPKKVEFYESQTGQVVHTLHAEPATKFSRGKFTSNTKFVLAGIAKNCELLAYKIEEKPMLVSKQKLPIKSATSLAVSGSLIAVGSASGDVVVATDKLSLLSVAKAAHRLPVSGLAISASGVVASVSVAGTVHVLKPPFSSKAWNGAFRTIGWVTLALSVLVLLAGIILSRLQTEGLALLWRDSSSASAQAHSGVPSQTEPIASSGSPAPEYETVYETVYENPETVYVDENDQVVVAADSDTQVDESLETVYETVYAEPTTIYKTIEPTTIYEVVPEPEADVEQVFEESESHHSEHAVEYSNGEIVHEHHIEQHNGEEPSVSIYDK